MLNLDTRSDAFLTDPWPVLKKFRQEAPICWSESEKLFNVFRHEDIAKLFLDQRFTVEYPWRTTTHLFGKTLLDMEGEEQQRLKKIIASSVLTGINVRNFSEKFVEPTVIKLIDDVVYEPSFDFMAEIASRVPTLATCQFLGIPLDQEKWLFEKMMVLMNHLGEIEINFEAVGDVHKEVDEWLTNILVNKFEQKQEDLGYMQMFDCVRDESMETIKLVYWTFLAGGIETSMCLLGNAFVILSNHQEWFKRLAEDSSMARLILNEALRLEPVQGNTVRFATQDLDLNGISIKKNQCVRLLLTSASRDESVFQEPDVFNPERSTRKRDLTFAIGTHACMGRNFTLTNSEIVLRTFWKKIQGVRDIDKIDTVIRGSLFRKPDSVWVNSKINTVKDCCLQA
ncbi:Cytochrome P450 [Thalassolituus maritimus]|uniref:Cytochrome P450 n=1 Tax=Thalassolituus maritimus TaxID=484498 RepID=A0A1N7Q998_9GAMM|nr:cytochrome P450 [Thalassolituus maritimus]SIT19411.1 Cytochrome P450 [Thalassolituus maritimus]